MQNRNLVVSQLDTSSQVATQAGKTCTCTYVHVHVYSVNAYTRQKLQYNACQTLVYPCCADLCIYMFNSKALRL